MRRQAKISAAIAVAIVAMLVISTPPRLEYNPAVDEYPDLRILLQDDDKNLVPGTEKRLVWFDGEQPTEWSVVALHGFSASRQESAPLAELIAKNLKANLFETRFAGHGLKENALTDVTAEDWLDDVAEALTAGRLIGRKIAVVAMSNGAALAMSMLDHPAMQAVDSMILLSPNFGPADPKSMWITRPLGPVLLRLISGDTRSWEAHNDLQARYWTTNYPTETLVQVIRVVDRAIDKAATDQAPRVQVYFSPEDSVVSVPAIEAAYASMQSPQKEIIQVSATEASGSHVIAGDIMSPANTLPIAANATDFILRRVP